MDQNDTSNQVEVTLRHPSFGEHVFRCEPEELGNVADDMMAEARAFNERRVKIAAIDQHQLELVGEIAKIDERIAAARLLNDPAHVRKQEDARAVLEDAIAELSVKREQVVAGPSSNFQRG